MGNLATLLKEKATSQEQILEELIVKWLLQCSQGLQFLHQRGILHANLRPENILIDRKGNVKISDYGFNELMPTINDLLPIEYFAYSSPETLMENKYSPEADIWSLGCIGYELCCHRVCY